MEVNYNEKRLQTFLDYYKEELTWDMLHNPKDYMIGVTSEVVFERMSAAICIYGIRKVCLTNNLKRVCSRLGIPKTYKGIEAYLNGESKQ